MGVKSKRQLIRFLIVLLIIMLIGCVSKNGVPDIPGEIPTKALFEDQLGALPEEADKLIQEVEQMKDDLIIQNPFENVQIPGQNREILNETRITFLGIMHFDDFFSFHEYNIDVAYFEYSQTYQVENLSGTLKCETYISTTDLGENPELSDILENGYLLFNHLISSDGETVLTFNSSASEGANEILKALNDSIDELQLIQIYIYTVNTYQAMDNTSTQDFNDNTTITPGEPQVTTLVNLNLDVENIPPEVTIVSGPDGEIVEPTSVFQWQGKDQDGHINSYKISKDGIEETTDATQATWTGYSVGDHIFNVQGTDNRGGLSNIIEWQFTRIPVQPLFTVSLESSPTEGGKTRIDDGELTEKASKTVKEGTEVEIQAVPNEDFTFEGWVDETGLVSIESQYSVIVNEDKDFKALFEAIAEYETVILAEPPEGGDIQLEERGWKDEDRVMTKIGDQIHLEARAEEKWRFLGWYYTDATELIPLYCEDLPHLEFIVEASNTRIEANFGREDTITVEASPNDGGKVKIDDGELTEKASKTVTEGTEVELGAVPNEGFTFEGWVDETGLVGVESQYSVTVNEDKDFKALFEPQQEEYLFRVYADPAEGGDIQIEDRGWKDEDSKHYKEGDNVIFRAREAEGWEFNGWFNENSQNPSEAISMDDIYFHTMEGTDITILAKFIRLHTITAESSPTEGGKVKIDDGELTEKASKTVTEGTEVELGAVPEEGFNFEGWVNETGLVSVESGISVIVEKDKLLTAIFEPVDPLDEYNLIVRANPAKGGDIQIDDQGWKDEDTIVAVESGLVPLHAKEEPQWIFLGWYWGGEFYLMETPLSDNKDYDFQMVGYDADLEALFGFIPETVMVEGGIFTMGDTFDDGDPNEKPVHEVALVRDFSIGKYEITNEQFVQFLNNARVEFNNQDRWGYLNGRKIIDERYFKQTGIVYSPGWGWDLKGDHQGTVYDYDQMPVINVTWFGAVEYCNWLSDISGLDRAYAWDEDKQTFVLQDYPPNTGYRLPTEAEWEYTARGGQNMVGNGNQWAGTSDDNCCEDYGWFEDNSNDHMPQPVGGKLPNEVGTFDMSGNACEWVSDVYQAYTADSETCPYYPGDNGQDNHHVARGGGFDWNDYNSTVCYRLIEGETVWCTALQLDNVSGFRIAKSE